MTRLPPLVLLASLAAVAPLGFACVGRDLNAGTVPDAGGPDAMGGTGGGPTVIASLIQLPPDNLVSDGTSLFWVTAMGSGGPIWSMPVGGGPITTVVPGLIGGGFLAVDNVNVYWAAQGGIYRAPKGGGGSPTLVNEPGAPIAGMTSLGSKAYWVEQQESLPMGQIAVKSAPLQGGGPIDLIAEFNTVGPPGGSQIAVTTTTVFLSQLSGQTSFFPLATGVPDGGTPTKIAGLPNFGCAPLVSDTDAVFCDVADQLFRLDNGGTATMVAPAPGTFLGGIVATDDKYVYWADTTTVGTIMRAPKAGGTAIILARDTVPGAIAVDANALYWYDQAGNMMRLAK
jgi:hypothetical protein